MRLLVVVELLRILHWDCLIHVWRVRDRIGECRTAGSLMWRVGEGWARLTLEGRRHATTALALCISKRLVRTWRWISHVRAIKLWVEVSTTSSTSSVAASTGDGALIAHVALDRLRGWVSVMAIVCKAALIRKVLTHVTLSNMY